MNEQFRLEDERLELAHKRAEAGEATEEDLELLESERLEAEHDAEINEQIREAEERLELAHARAEWGEATAEDLELLEWERLEEAHDAQINEEIRLRFELARSRLLAWRNKATPTVELEVWAKKNAGTSKQGDNNSDSANRVDVKLAASQKWAPGGHDLTE